MASADPSSAIGCRRRHPAPVARRAGEVSHGKTLHFLGSAAGSTRACDGRSIGRPRLLPGCPTALALYPMSVRRPPDWPPASSPPRIAATQLPPACAGAGFWLPVPLLAARGGLSPPSSVPCVAHYGPRPSPG